MSRKGKPKTRKKVILVHDRLGNTETNIEFSRLEVLIRKIPPPVNAGACRQQHVDDDVRLRRPDVVWLFFNRTSLVCVVILHSLPQRFRSKEICREVWPCELRIDEVASVLSRVRMSDGSKSGPFHDDPRVVVLDDSLWGTPSFWDPLYEESDAFMGEELKWIRELAEQKGRPTEPCTTARNEEKLRKGVLYAFDHFTLLRTAERNYTVARPLALVAIRILMQQHPQPIERQVWFRQCYAELNRPEPAYERWKPKDWFRGKNDEEEVMKDLVYGKARMFALKPCFTGVKIH